MRQEGQFLPTYSDSEACGLKLK